MTEAWVNITSQQFNIKDWQVLNTWKLLSEGATIPFISRYRKERTGELDEVKVQQLKFKLEYINELEERKKFIHDTIEQQGLLTNELAKSMEDCMEMERLEDIYLPYKPKRRTKASIAREKGLEPLAKLIFEQKKQDLSQILQTYLNEEVPDKESAIEGATFIIAEYISDNAYAREIVRQLFERYAEIESKVIKTKIVEAEKYKMYFEYKEKLAHCPSHRILAMRRGENEGFLRVNIHVDNEYALEKLEPVFIKGKGEASSIVKNALTEAYEKHILPSIENEFAAKSKQKADTEAIFVFSQNLQQLLLAPPIGEKRILALDPGFRTGCKLVCLDEHGNLLHNETIYPHPPVNDVKLAEKKIVSLVSSYKIDYIAIGDGTAGRETEAFINKIAFQKPIRVYVVSEAGASIYSASDIARKEFPQFDITVRGSVSIGRRLQDPLAELVKIEPKSMGVGQYQHDVDQKLLKNALDDTVMACVNKVGVKLNTASEYLLKYVSGIGEKMAHAMVEYRTKHGRFNSLNDLYNVPRFGDKVFQLSAGFLRIDNSDNPLENTGIHPENYALVEKMAKNVKCSVRELIRNKEMIKQIVPEQYVNNEFGLPTVLDILKELENQGYDIRFSVKILQFDPTIKTFEDLKEGMILNGIITNITNFGIFVNIGIKENGLVHISNITNAFIKNPAEVVHLHEHVKVKVLSADVNSRRIQLSMKDVET
jgi:uncharacterized protein